MENKKRFGIIGIFVYNPKNYKKINQILSSYFHLIKGRLGIPFKEESVRVISIIFEGTTDELGALTGKLGQLRGVEVKTLLSKVESQKLKVESQQKPSSQKPKACRDARPVRLHQETKKLRNLLYNSKIIAF